VDTLGLPDSWALATVPVRRQRRIMKEIVDLGIPKRVEIWLQVNPVWNRVTTLVLSNFETWGILN
jgi:hypothetical protein